jgi:hypothetical protein
MASELCGEVGAECESPDSFAPGLAGSRPLRLVSHPTGLTLDETLHPALPRWAFLFRRFAARSWEFVAVSFC